MDRKAFLALNQVQIAQLIPQNIKLKRQKIQEFNFLMIKKYDLIHNYSLIQLEIHTIKVVLIRQKMMTG